MGEILNGPLHYGPRDKAVLDLAGVRTGLPLGEHGALLELGLVGNPLAFLVPLEVAGVEAVRVEPHTIPARDLWRKRAHPYASHLFLHLHTLTSSDISPASALSSPPVPPPTSCSSQTCCPV